MPPTESAPRPLRSDAQRNRARILAAAEEIFAARGPSASTEDIARRADVAIGTVFRHFPTKAALVEAVFAGRLRAITEQAAALAGAPDPGEAFFAFFAEAVRQSTVKHTFVDAIDDADPAMVAVWAVVATAGADLRDAMDTLLVRAQRSGAVRPDITVGDVVALMIGTARALEQAGPDPATQDRLRSVVADGLRRH
ncbi:helix-turn-helix domain-containing protein [Dactylosporangium sp. NPDC005572]|uniref:TetR/AcrR family transcriptional regulator n=1 Tax=Dactylosporangium sp. NPDC005572 TaxID=3156889 RepID=UPI0033A96944